MANRQLILMIIATVLTATGVFLSTGEKGRVVVVIVGLVVLAVLAIWLVRNLAKGE